VLRLAGDLPLAPLGVAAYLVLLVAMLVLPQPLPPAFGVMAAVGAHLALVLMLWKEKVLCRGCVVTAGSVLVAGIASSSGIGAAWLPWFGGTIVASGLATWFVTRGAGRLYTLRITQGSIDLVRQVLREHLEVPEGTVKLIVYLREGCTACALYHSVYRPGLEQDLEEAVVIEERDAGTLHIGTPLWPWSRIRPET
jgi:hypothetical protein